MLTNLKTGFAFVLTGWVWSISLHHTYGQQLARFSVENGKLLTNRVADLWPTTVQGRVWLRQDMPMPAAYLENDSVTYLPQSQTGFNPFTNPIIGAYASNTGTTWLAMNRLPGWIEGPLGNSNGGLVRIQNNTFTIYNSLNFPPLSGLKETLWYSSAMSPDFSKFWVGGDSGIRSVDLATFQVRRFFNDTMTTLTQSYWREGKASKTGIWFRRDNYRWAFQSADTLQMLENSRFGLPDTLLLLDVAFVKTDTFFLCQNPHNSHASVWKRNIGSAMESADLKLKHLAVERDSLLWLVGESGLFVRKQGLYFKDTLFHPDGKSISAFKIDASGNKWIGTLDSGLYRISNLSVRIVSGAGHSENYCYTRPVPFKAQISSSVGKSFQYFWRFGDGKTSTEPEPEHLFGWTGKFKIRLTVKDEFGAVAYTSDTLLLIYKPEIWMNPHKDTLYTCGSEIFKTTYGSLPVEWHLPDGTQKTDSQLVASIAGLYYFKTNEVGCRGSDSIVLAQTPVRQGVLEIRYGTGDTLLTSDTIAAYLPIQVKATEADSYCAHTWTLNDSMIGNVDILQMEVSKEGLYEVKHESSSLSNCRSEANFTFYIKEKKRVIPPPVPPLEIPNLVTQNTDGKNDRFEIEQLPFYPQNALTLYNRWGMEVFSASPYQNNWPDADATPGTYFYHLEAGGKTYTGWVMVVK